MSNHKQGLRAPTPFLAEKKRPERKRYLDHLEEAMVAGAGIPAAWSAAAAASRAEAPAGAFWATVFSTSAESLSGILEKLPFRRTKGEPQAPKQVNPDRTTGQRPGAATLCRGGKPPISPIIHMFVLLILPHRRS